MKNDTGGGCDAKKFLQPIFLATQFSLLLISLVGSNNIMVNNNKKYSKGYRDVRDMGCSGCGMFGMSNVRDVTCLGCGMWDVGCAIQIIITPLFFKK